MGLVLAPLCIPLFVLDFSVLDKQTLPSPLLETFSGYLLPSGECPNIPCKALNDLPSTKFSKMFPFSLGIPPPIPHAELLVAPLSCL